MPYYLISGISLAIIAQLINYFFIKLNLFENHSFYIKIFFVNLTLLPIIFILNYGFASYYRYFAETTSYVNLYLVYIISSILFSIFVQYFAQGDIFMTPIKILGIFLILVGAYFSLK